MQPLVASNLKPGQVLRDQGITVTVPRRGEFVWAEVHRTDGSAQTIQVETLRDGRVLTRNLGDDRFVATPAVAATSSRSADAESTAAAQTAAGRSVDDLRDARTTATTPDSGTECGSSSYYLYNWRMSTYKWKFQSSTVPSYLRNRTNGTSIVLGQLTRANQNIVTARNNCGRPDYISASYSYEGTTTRSNNISSSARCTGGDGYSVVNFGYLPSGVFGMACAYGVSSTGTAREGDIRLSYGVRWETYQSLCSSETLIQSVATHEMGHVYGLGHVYGSPQTMNPYTPNCSLSPTTLGLGDMLGLERKY